MDPETDARKDNGFGRDEKDINEPYVRFKCVLYSNMTQWRTSSATMTHMRQEKNIKKKTSTENKNKKPIQWEKRIINLCSNPGAHVSKLTDCPLFMCRRCSEFISFSNNNKCTSSITFAPLTWCIRHPQKIEVKKKIEIKYSYTYSICVLTKRRRRW